MPPTKVIADLVVNLECAPSMPSSALLRKDGTGPNVHLSLPSSRTYGSSGSSAEPAGGRPGLPAPVQQLLHRLHRPQPEHAGPLHGAPRCDPCRCDGGASAADTLTIAP